MRLLMPAKRISDTPGNDHLKDRCVRAAMAEPDPLLRSLNAIHLATARLLGNDLTALLTYDDHLAKAADDAGIPVHTPHSG